MTQQAKYNMARYPHKYVVSNEKCVISIDWQSYDVTSWHNYHPGDAESIDNFHHKDATESFYAYSLQGGNSKIEENLQHNQWLKGLGYIRLMYVLY